MKGVILNKFGPPDVLMISQLECPRPGLSEVLVQVKATSVNPMDWKIRKYGISYADKSIFPIILGMEVAGVVRELGKDSKKFKLGDKVFGYINLKKMGGYAEFATVNESELEIIPVGMSFFEAAALPVAGITALQGLFGIGKLEAGQKVLIHAAAGGVGTLAVQLAKLHGAEVIGTASKRNHKFLKGLGIDQVIDYSEIDFETCVKNVDLVFDGVGGEVQHRSYKVLKNGGKLVSITDVPDHKLAEKFHVTVGHVWANPNCKLLKLLGDIYIQGNLKPIISEILLLEEVQKAHIESEKGHVRGKLILEP